MYIYLYIYYILLIEVPIFASHTSLASIREVEGGLRLATTLILLNRFIIILAF